MLSCLGRSLLVLNQLFSFFQNGCLCCIELGELCSHLIRFNFLSDQHCTTVCSSGGATEPRHMLLLLLLCYCLLSRCRQSFACGGSDLILGISTPTVLARACRKRCRPGLSLLLSRELAWRLVCLQDALSRYFSC